MTHRPAIFPDHRALSEPIMAMAVGRETPSRNELPAPATRSSQENTMPRHLFTIAAILTLVSVDASAHESRDHRRGHQHDLEHGRQDCRPDRTHWSRVLPSDERIRDDFACLSPHEAEAAHGVDGWRTLRHADGTRASQAYFRNGQADGWVTVWHPGGQKSYSAYYRRGVISGWVTAWHRNGTKRLSAYVQDGTLNGWVTRWHANGTKAESGYYQSGVRNGYWTVWNRRGTKLVSGYYSSGTPNGYWTAYHHNGRKRMQAYLSDGRYNGWFSRYAPSGVRLESTMLRDAPIAGRGHGYAGRRHDKRHRRGRR